MTLGLQVYTRLLFPSGTKMQEGRTSCNAIHSSGLRFARPIKFINRPCIFTKLLVKSFFHEAKKTQYTAKASRVPIYYGTLPHGLNLLGSIFALRLPRPDEKKQH